MRRVMPLPVCLTSFRHTGGVAAVEFALIAPILLFLLVVMLDFGYAFSTKLKMTNAVTVAAQYAFTQGQSVSPGDVATFIANIRTVVLETAQIKNPPTVTVLFNNTSSAANAANYYCVVGSPPTWTSTGEKSAGCGGLVMSGQYVAIAASGQSPTFFFNNPIFGPLLGINETAIVRVR